MGLSKGKTNNPKGRPQGTPNKSTKEIKDLINNFISRNIDTVQNDYMRLEPKDRLLFLEKLFKYVIPTKTDNEININNLSDNELTKLCETILNKMDNESESK